MPALIPSPSWIAIWTEFPSYPGMANPKLKISTLLQAIDGLWKFVGKSGPGSKRKGRQQIATHAATATGMKLRGFHSNNSNSTASIKAAIGEPKIAVMPAAAPATSSVLRSAALIWKNWANKEPIAPPVMMIGPSAPNGPPAPIEIAEDSGFRSATLGDIRLPPIKMASIASGIPWPRIFSEPKRAIKPMISPPITGAETIQSDRGAFARDDGSVLKCPNHTTLVTSAIRLTSTHAANAPPVPTMIAMPINRRTRLSVVKSPASRRASPPVKSCWRCGGLVSGFINANSPGPAALQRVTFPYRGADISCYDINQ